MGGPRDLAFKGIQIIHDQGMYGCVVCCTVIHIKATWETVQQIMLSPLHRTWIFCIFFKARTPIHLMTEPVYLFCEYIPVNSRASSTKTKMAFPKMEGLLCRVISILCRVISRLITLHIRCVGSRLIL